MKNLTVKPKADYQDDGKADRKETMTCFKKTTNKLLANQEKKSCMWYLPLDTEIIISHRLFIGIE